MYQSPSLFNSLLENPPDFSGGVAHCVTHFQSILVHCLQKSAPKLYQKWVFSQEKSLGNCDCCDKKACQTEKSDSFYFFLASWHIASHFPGQVRADYTSELANGLTFISHLPGAYLQQDQRLWWAVHRREISWFLSLIGIYRKFVATLRTLREELSGRTTQRMVLRVHWKVYFVSNIYFGQILNFGLFTVCFRLEFQ